MGFRRMGHDKRIIKTVATSHAPCQIKILILR